MGWGEECPNGISTRIEQRRPAEFVAQDLQRILREAVCEAEECFVEGRFEGVWIVVGVGGFAGGGAGGLGVVEADGVCYCCWHGRGRRFADGFVVCVQVVGGVGGWEGGLWGPGF